MAQWLIEDNGEEVIYKLVMPKCEFLPLPEENQLIKVEVADNEVDGIFIDIEGVHGASLDLMNGEVFPDVEAAKMQAIILVSEYLMKCLNEILKS